MWSLLLGTCSHTSITTPSNWFTTGTMLILMHGPRSYTSSTTPSTTSSLLLHGIYCTSLAPILSLLLRLLIHDWYYMDFTAWASLPYF
jgi:hypothetical protein